MPLIESTYRPPWILASGHGQTILPALLRRVPPLAARRERIATPDDDFLDLDWQGTDWSRIAIISHGLEGSSRAPYVQGMARALVRRGWGVVAWNCRGCSGELNRQLRFYHSGSSDDLGTVVDHVLATVPRAPIALLGFSLGGNQTLKYLGEQGEAVSPRIEGAVTFSVPCDLAASSERLAHWSNRFYMEHFMRTLRRKLVAKAGMYPGQLDVSGVENLRTFRDVDNRYTAPLHGFVDAEDYWYQAGSLRFLAAIRVRTLLVNARDDPFLAGGCFPREIATANDHLWLETPRHGGHVGFIPRRRTDEYWSETRAGAFLQAG